MNKENSIIINGFEHISFKAPFHYSLEETIRRSNDYYQWLNKRRSIRYFSSENIPKSVIENLIQTASTAPSGAHKQPWVFCAVSNKDLKHAIREAAEKEEKENYTHRMTAQWKKDLAPLATNEV